MDSGPVWLVPVTILTILIPNTGTFTDPGRICRRDQRPFWHTNFTVNTDGPDCHYLSFVTKIILRKTWLEFFKVHLKFILLFSSLFWVGTCSRMPWNAGIQIKNLLQVPEPAFWRRTTTKYFQDKVGKVGTKNTSDFITNGYESCISLNW